MQYNISACGKLNVVWQVLEKKSYDLWSKQLLKRREKIKRKKRARGSYYRWWVRFIRVPQQLGFSLVIPSSCKPGFSGTETVFMFKPLANQVKYLRVESSFFGGLRQHLINSYSEIKMLSVLPSHCIFGHGVRTWSRVKGNFGKGFLEFAWVGLVLIVFGQEWEALQCHGLSIWLSGKAFFKWEAPGAHCRFL